MGDGEVGDAGVAADDGAGAGDQGGEPVVGQAAAEGVRVGQVGELGQPGHQVRLVRSPGDDDPAPACVQRLGDGRVPFHRPAAGGGAGAGVQDDGAGGGGRGVRAR